MIEGFSPAGLAAVSRFKIAICESVGADALNDAALFLAGLPPAEIDEGLNAYSCSLAEDFVHCGLPERLRAGLRLDPRAGRRASSSRSGDGFSFA
jgi:hypothetical protein